MNSGFYARLDNNFVSFDALEGIRRLVHSASLRHQPQQGRASRATLDSGLVKKALQWRQLWPGVCITPASLNQGVV